jgi:hypothetical protein
MTQVETVTEQLARLQADNDSLRRRLGQGHEPAATSGDDQPNVSRRTLLRRAGAGAVGLGAVATLGPTLAARAADGDPVLAGNDNPSSSATLVTSTDPRGFVGRTSATAPSNNHNPAGIVGISFNAAGSNFADAPSGVLGITSNAIGFNMGVQGVASSPDGIGVAGRAVNNSSEGMGVYGEAQGPDGVGVRGVAPSIGVYATAIGPGSTGVSGDGHRYGVSGFCSDLNGFGVDGAAPYGGGRGGQFSGMAAQVRLLPSTASTHPHSGKAGDLFVDASHRLWFCKGRTTWKLLA